MENNMKSLKTGLAVSLLTLCLAVPAMAQSLALPAYMTGDHSMRASKVIGMPVYNEHGEKIGVIDDITLPTAGGEVSAVLSVGGYLGGAPKLVKVPLSHVQMTTEKPMMPADKTALMAMPNYNYAGGGL
jgi:sporulation protein YlmC with PRC-barrel domain